MVLSLDEGHTGGGGVTVLFHLLLHLSEFLHEKRFKERNVLGIKMKGSKLNKSKCRRGDSGGQSWEEA